MVEHTRTGSLTYQDTLGDTWKLGDLAALVIPSQVLNKDSYGGGTTPPVSLQRSGGSGCQTADPPYQTVGNSIPVAFPGGRGF